MSEEPAIYYAGPQAPAAKPRRRRKDPPAASVYGPGRYRPAPNGRGFDCVICFRLRQIRARLPDEASARAWIDAQDEALRLRREPLTRARLLDAQEACAVLPPGATLLQAARAFAAASAAPPSLPLPEAAARFLERRAEAARPVTLRKYRHALAQLALLAPGKTVAEIAEADVLALLEGRAGRTRNNYLRHLATFFRWAVGEGLAAADPAARVLRGRPPEPRKGVLAVAQCRALLAAAAAKKPRMVPYLALALFTGVRPGELEKLDSGRIGGGFVRVDGAIAKTADARNVAVRPALAAWLRAFPPPPGRVAPLSTKHLYGALRRLRYWAGRLAQETGDASFAVPDWPDDCTRHSYATYMYELTKDAAAVAADLGHAGTDVFFRHYRALCAPGDGRLFTQITPKSVAKLISILQRLTEPVDNQRSPKPS